MLVASILTPATVDAFLAIPQLPGTAHTQAARYSCTQWHPHSTSLLQGAGKYRGRRARITAVLEGAEKKEAAASAKEAAVDLSSAGLTEVREALDQVLEQQWAKSYAAISDTADKKQQTQKEFNTKSRGVKHVVGGFSVVIRMPEHGVAYRLQPMRSLKSGLTWVAFYRMLLESSKDSFAIAQAMSCDVLFRPDRSVVLGRSTMRRAWEDFPITEEFQAERLRKSTLALARNRHQLLSIGSSAFQKGLCTSAATCEIFPEADGGMLDGPTVFNGLMFPSHWFWLKVGMPSEEAVEWRPAASDNHEEAAQSHDDLHDAPKVPNRRMKGSELASLLLLRGSAAAAGKDKAFDPARDAVPVAVATEPVPVLASVFPHAQGDIGGLNKRLWIDGAPDNVTLVVLQSVLRGLRRLHAVGVPHGDLKAANVLYANGHFCLTDLPALNWSATPVLTKDPVAHTLLRGKRLLCNDMWGMGMVCLSMVCGFRRIESVKVSLRRLFPSDYSPERSASKRMDSTTQNWLVVILLLLKRLEDVGTPATMDAGKSARAALKSGWLRRHVPAVASKQYLEECKRSSSELLACVLASQRSLAIIDALAYSLDVTDTARNALGMPWPSEDEDVSLEDDA